MCYITTCVCGPHVTGERLPWRGSWHVSGLKQRAHCLTLESCISVAWAPLSTLISNAARVDLRPSGWIEREPVRQCEMGNEPVCPDLLHWLLMWAGINGLFRSKICEPDQWDGRGKESGGPQTWAHTGRSFYSRLRRSEEWRERSKCFVGVLPPLYRRYAHFYLSSFSLLFLPFSQPKYSTWKTTSILN